MKATKRLWKTKSQILAWMLIICMLASVLPVQKAAAAESSGVSAQQAAATESSGFQDVRPTDWFYDAVNYVQKNGIFSGSGAGVFSPKGTMTRAMYVTALGRMAGVEVSEYSTSTFADVQSGMWYAPYVEWAVKKGITAGTGGRSFSPNATISREQIAAMTLRYFESYQISYQSSKPITTEPGDLAYASSWAADAVVKLWQAGLIVGDANGNFNPHAQAIRAEAAVIFMRINAVVEAWVNQNQPTVTPTPTPTPTTTPTSVPTPEPGGSGGGSSPHAPKYTLTFESNGGTEIAEQKVEQGKALSKLPVPVKEGYIFQGWFQDGELSLIFAEGSAVHADMTLYAKYMDHVSQAVKSVPSYSVLDVAPSFTIAVNDTTGGLTASEVQAGMTFTDTADPDIEEIAVTGADGLFTISSASEGSRFAAGHTYQLTLTDDNLTFQGQDATTRIYVFSVAKQEVMNIPLNPNMVYLPFADVTDMMLEGAEINSPAIPILRTTVGDSEGNLAAANAGSGTFVYTGGASIQVGDAVAIYEGVRPDLRTLETTGADNGDVAYVQITAINGSTYAYDHADAKQVLSKPDILPVNVEADTDGEEDNGSITIQHTALNYSDSLYAPLGLNELTTVDVGDFIAFYRGEFDVEGSEVVRYGRITSIAPAAEMDVITYTNATAEDVKHVFNIYQKQALEGDQLLTDEDVAMIEDQMERQAISSGFVDQAADYLSSLALQTEEFKALPRTKVMSRLSGDNKVSVENLTVVASLGTKLNNIAGQTSGVSATLQVGADIVIRINEESDLVIHMTGTFLQEISLNLGIDGETEWGEACLWFICIPYPNDYRISANLDAHTFTGINVTAEIGTVEHDKLEDALADWDKAATGGTLSKVRDIATEIKALIEGAQDTGVDEESLREQYQEMMENETDWVPLIKKKLFEKSKRVVYGIIEVNFSAEFVVKANVNLTIGADFNYTTAKRYSATVRVFSFTGTSSTVSLPGDGNYRFTFYVMGTLGLRAGINLELRAGIGSVDLNSIGLSIEPGAYVNLWGYFYYQLQQLNGVERARSLGALYVEIGIYLESAVGAQLGDGLLSASVPIYENMWPLYTAGEQQHVVNFAYPQDKAPTVNLAGSASSISIPQTLLTMSTFDLKTGEMGTRAYDRFKFDIQVDNRNFRYRLDTGKIEVVNRDIQVSEGNLVITWKGAPLSYSSDSLTRKIPLHWLARTGDYTIQLDPQNGGMTQVVAAPYKTAIRVDSPVYQGYTFDGWHWTSSGSSKVDIPSSMPAQDWYLYAHWIPNTDTPYTVQHYLIDPNTRTATSPAATETLTGTTGTEIQIASDKFKDQGYATGKASGVLIKGDGSTVVKVNYYPMNRTMTFDWAYAGAPASSVTEATGKNITARIPLPARPGYTFAGWSPDVPAAMPAADTTYTANWTAREDTPYQVAYLLQNIGDDTYTVADTELYRGKTDTMASLTNPTRAYAGFTFDGTVPGTVTSALIASKGTTVLKLYYKRDTYAMTIDYNGSGDATKVIQVPFGATTGIRLGTPEWQGHAFTGWTPADVTTMPAEAVKFTAQWTLNTHTVSFNSNGGSAVNAETVGYGLPASEPGEPTKDGVVFGGWYSDSALTSAYDFATQVTADLTLHAKWLRSYTVSFDSNGGSAVDAQTVYEGDKAAAPAAPTKEGFVFSGWYSDTDLTSVYDFETNTVTANMTLYAKWTIAAKNNYTVSFNSNGGTAVADLTVEEGAVATAPGAPTLIGQTFEGWYSDSGLTSRFNFSTTQITANLTLYAKWTINSYTVTFNSNGGSAVANQTVVYDGNATQPATPPTRNGYTFNGWYSDASLTAAYNFSAQVRSSFTLYAKWTAVYTVSFNSNGGSPVASQTVANGGNASEPDAPTKDGYTFGGWYSDAALGEAYLFAERQVIANLTLHAKWTLDSYTVSFDSNNGPAVLDQAVLPGGKAAAPVLPKWAGYRFDGWYGDEELTQAYDFSTAVNADITLYAKWTMTSWVELGNTTVTDVYEEYSGIVVDNQGIPYVAIVDSNRNVFVKKYVEATDEWQDVGDPTELAKARNYAGISLAIDKENMLYIAYLNETDRNLVKKYTDGVWETVVDLGRLMDDVSIAFDQDNTPYFAYVDASTTNTNYAILVGKLDNGNMVNLDRIGANNAGDMSIGFDGNDTLYLFYTYFTQNIGTRAALVKYEGQDRTKSVLGQPPSPANIYRSSFAINPVDDIPYMTYADSNNKVHVSKFENGAWQSVGTAGFSKSLDGFSHMDIAFDSAGIPYLAYIDATVGNSVTLMKFDNDAWSVVEYPGVTVRNKISNRINIYIDTNDNVYVSFVFKTSNLTLDNKVNVVKYDPSLH